MLVHEISETIYRIELTPEELLKFDILTASSPHLSIIHTKDMIHYILTYSTEHSFEIVKDPLTHEHNPPE